MGRTHIVRRELEGFVREGEYEQVSRYDGSPSKLWRLRRWRVIAWGKECEWRKVHGNQRRDVAGFPLERLDPGWEKDQ